MTENKRTCFKCGRSPYADNITLFRFPKLGVRNLVRCELWAKYIFPDKTSTLDLQRKLFSEHRMLCQEHFKNEDFLDTTKKYLVRNAVPFDVLKVNENIVQPTEHNYSRAQPPSMPPFDRESEALHCSSEHGQKRENNLVEEGSSQKGKITIKKKVSTDETCRICLKDGNMPIFGDNSTELCESIYEIGAVEVCADDPYPKFLCQACLALLQGAILFRKTAQKSDDLLKTRTVTAKKPEPISDTDEPDGYFSYDSDNIPIKGKVKCPNLKVCLRCDIEFNTFQEYSDHLLSAEHENKRVTCHICKNTYAHQHFKRHMSLHKKETGHICDICGKKFAVKSVFTRHRVTHFYNLPFQCALCPYRGRFPESLKMHMRMHTGERPYLCEQCPSRFRCKSNLRMHTQTHKGERDFRCETCARGFYTKRNLEMHFKVDHARIMDHVCRICGKTFGYRKRMMNHELKVHKREKLKSGIMPIYLRVESMKQQNVDVATKS